MQGQNLTLKPFLYIKSSSSYSLHSLHTKNLPQITQIHTDYSLLKNICEYLRSAGEHSYPAWKVFSHRLRGLTQIFVTQEHLWISVRSAGDYSYSAWKVFSHRLRRLTQMFVTQEYLWISVRSVGEHSYPAWKVIPHRLRGLTQILVFSRTSVNICEICGRTFISCLKGILPQITQINTDFCFLKNICEYLWNLRENIHMLLER